jgi:hypothetical protein
MFVTVELLYRTREKRESKREWQSISNIIKHNICEGGGYKDVCWKLLKKCVYGVLEGKGVRKSNGRYWMDQDKLYPQQDTQTPLNINLNINNERQDCNIDTVEGTSGRGESEWRRLRWGYMVGRLYIVIWNRTKKPLAIALSGAGRELRIFLI